MTTSGMTYGGKNGLQDQAKPKKTYPKGLVPPTSAPCGNAGQSDLPNVLLCFRTIKAKKTEGTFKYNILDFNFYVPNHSYMQEIGTHFLIISRLNLFYFFKNIIIVIDIKYKIFFHRQRNIKYMYFETNSII